MKRVITVFLFLIFFISAMSTSYAHPGRLDAQGGHMDYSTGTYHYHSGESTYTQEELDDKLSQKSSTIYNKDRSGSDNNDSTLKKDVKRNLHTPKPTNNEYDEIFSYINIFTKDNDTTLCCKNSYKEEISVTVWNVKSVNNGSCVASFGIKSGKTGEMEIPSGNYDISFSACSGNRSKFESCTKSISIDSGSKVTLKISMFGKVKVK